MYDSDMWIKLIVLPLLVLGVTAVILMPFILRSRERFKAHETFRYLIDKGQQPPAELLSAIVERPRVTPPRERDLRASVVWLSIAIGISAFGSAIAWVSDPEGRSWVIAPGLGAFPASIGLGYLLLWILNRNKPLV